MSTTLPVLLLFLGLFIGAILGWLLREYRSNSARPSDEYRALQESQRRQAELAPLEKAMDRLGFKLQELEEDRATALAALSSQVQAVTRTSTRLTDRTD